MCLETPLYEITKQLYLKLHIKYLNFLEFHLGSSGDPASRSTPIRWKEGFDLAAKAAQRAAAAAARSGRKRPLENRTFFSWFCDNGDPSADDVAEVIKDDMWYVPKSHS